MRSPVRILPALAAAGLSLPAAAHEAGALHVHAAAVLVPLLLAAACIGLVAAAGPRPQRRPVPVERRDRRA